MGTLVLSGLGAGSYFGQAPAFGQSPKSSSPKAPVTVLYAGSLVGVMTKSIGPSFTKATGYAFNGIPGGSGALATEIQGGLQKADVFISAAPSADATLEGSKGGNWVKWYFTLGTSPLVIGYNPSSKFASKFKHEPWWKVLSSPGIQLGRTDPAIDPKGALTYQMVQAEAKKLHRPSLTSTILGAKENPQQVFPEETLVARLSAGQLDAGFFFLNEARYAKIPTVSTGLSLSAHFTVTIPRSVGNLAGAVAFIRYLYAPHAKSVFAGSGLQITKVAVTGSKSSVPRTLKGLISHS